jgi:undecaprenyl-diphosphatase
MFDWSYGIDLALFRFCNSSLASAPADAFFPFITDVHHWYPVYVALLAFIMLHWKKSGVMVSVLLLITILISDQFSSSVLKPLIGRIRPCEALEHVRILVGCGGGKSFPSSHAVNNFAAAQVLSSTLLKWKPYVYAIAGVVAFSRIYVGVHYPSDAIGGAMIGLLVGWITVKAGRAMNLLPNLPLGDKS